MFTSFYEALWVFYLYSFLGWCTEVVFHVVSKGHFINRGFLIGPVCPIYGLGILAVVAALEPLSGNLALLYVGSVVITSAIELALGWISKQVLHERLWDYSKMPFNVGGYICLAFSLIWGFACLCVLRIFHPLVMELIRWIPYTLGMVLLWVFSVTILADLCVTGITALQIPRQLRAVEEIEKALRSISYGIGEGLSEPVLNVMEKRPEIEARMEKYRQSLPAGKRDEWEKKLEHYRELLAGRNWTQRRLTLAFPHLQESLAMARAGSWREYYRTRREERRLAESAAAGKLSPVQSGVSK